MQYYDISEKHEFVKNYLFLKIIYIFFHYDINFLIIT